MATILLSHPDQELKDHLIGVKNMAFQLWGERGVRIWNPKLLADLLCITTFAHDFGKATAYFQRYIKSPDLGKKRGGPRERHALLSAVVGYFLAKHYLRDHVEAEKLSFFVLVAIKRHHGNLQDIVDEFTVFSDEDANLLREQIRSIDFSLLRESMSPLFDMLPPPVNQLQPFTEEILETWVVNMKQELRRIRRRWLEESSHRIPLFSSKGPGDIDTKEKTSDLLDYFRFLFLYSLLLDADKSQVGVRAYSPPAVHLPSTLVDKYKEKQNWVLSGINVFREQAYQEIAGNLPLANQGQIFSITLPTGLGKTLAAYNLAFKLRKKRCLERGIAPKIIYALPFLTVIDQNYQVLTDILQDQGVLSGHHVVTKHHHLAEPIFNIQTDNEEVVYALNAAKLLVEGWVSDIVVTTFVQLFETLIGWRNSSLRRFHRLAHSIIILDEIQAVPIPYWLLIQQILQFLANQMSVDIILVTATQPKIFTGSKDIFETAEPQKYFAQMDRVKLEVNLTQRTIQDFVAEELLDQLRANPEKSFLIILNTISSAKQLYRELVKKIDEPIAFLSTGVVMKERKERIEKISKKSYRLAVSTQLVEAGVDIDFDIVYRDFAPMDSINQAAGRCNRHAMGSGLMRVISLCNERGRTYAGMIYNAVALDITRQILEDRKVIDEKEFLALIDLYFEQAKSKTLTEESSQLLQAMEQLRFSSDDSSKTSVSSFHLIREKGLRGNVFIELDEKAQKVWREYEKILEIKDFYERQEKFAAIKQVFYEYVISIPVYNLTDMPPLVNHFFYVSNEQLSYYYDSQLGYDSKGIEIIF